MGTSGLLWGFSAGAGVHFCCDTYDALIGVSRDHLGAMSSSFRSSPCSEHLFAQVRFVLHPRRGFDKHRHGLNKGGPRPNLGEIRPDWARDEVPSVHDDTRPSAQQRGKPRGCNSVDLGQDLVEVSHNLMDAGPDSAEAAPNLVELAELSRPKGSNVVQIRRSHQLCSIPGRIWPNSVGFGPSSADTRPTLADSGAELADVVGNCPTFGQLWPDFGRR